MTASTKPSKGLQPRRLAAARLAEVLRGNAFVPFSFADIADSRDRALANRLVTLALRRHGHINEAILALMPRGLPKKAGSFEAVLRLALGELLFGAANDDHAVLFLAGETIKADPRARHQLRLLNGVLRNAQRRRQDFTALPGAALFPEWLAARWRRAYGEKALQSFADALLAAPPLDLSLKPGTGEGVKQLDGNEILAGTIRLDHRDRSVADLPGYQEGEWWVQDLAASLPARLIDLPRGAEVLDLCAAPGGKTAQLAAAGYKVTAVDSDKGRLELLKTNLDRVRLSARIVCTDARSFDDQHQFDAVLVDAPCSATGTFRRHPEIVWQRDAAGFAQRAKMQGEIVENALGRLRPGGILVYSTCSLEPEEGEEVVAAVMQRHEGLRIAPVTGAEIGGLAEAITGAGFVRTHPGLSPAGRSGSMDGFFIARMIRA